MTDITLILNAIEQGNTGAADQLLPVVYEELRLLAAQRLSRESPGQTLQATALVHEAYIRLVEAENQNWNNRRHFFAAAAEAMRRILIDSARRKKSIKRGGNHQRVDLDESILAGTSVRSGELLALNEALQKLEKKDKVKADLVKLRYFAGLTSQQAAQVLGISHSTADEYWAYARACLRVEISKGDETPQS